MGSLSHWLIFFAILLVISIILIGLAIGLSLLLWKIVARSREVAAANPNQMDQGKLGKPASQEDANALLIRRVIWISLGFFGGGTLGFVVSAYFGRWVPLPLGVLLGGVLGLVAVILCLVLSMAAQSLAGARSRSMN